MSENKINSTEQGSASSSITKRRSFLKKAVVGASIVSIPSHSVWAGRLISGNMSGNVSGWGECDRLAIYSHGYYKTTNKHHTIASAYLSLTWASVFGVTRLPFTDKETTPDPDTTLQHFVDLNGVNAQLATMFINASLSETGDGQIYWPVVTNGTFASTYAYAEYLWDQANIFGAAAINTQLSNIINEHHVGTGTKATCN